MKKTLIFALLNLLPFFANAQLLVDNTTQTPTELLQNVLLGNGVIVSNITFNGSAANANAVRDQVGYFSTGLIPTNLGIEEGLILATGKATIASGPNEEDAQNDQTDFPMEGDSDLLYIADNPIMNKAVLEFDFIPNGNQLNFNFVFASEEYPEFVNSEYNDVFGFFISGPGILGPFTGTARNIARIPTSTTGLTSVSINNVNGGFSEIPGCPFVVPGTNPSNQLYYVNNCGGTSIQYDGFTTVLTATANVQCGQLYHFKLAIANVVDNGYDSAVFLQANSFSANPINLGSDLTVANNNALCEREIQLLDTGLGDIISHQWYQNGELISGATSSTYYASEAGVYLVIAYPFGVNCPIEDSILVEYFEVETLDPQDIIQCSDVYDLTVNTAIVLGTLNPEDYEVRYFLNELDSINFTNSIANPLNFNSTANPQTIYIGIFNIAKECIIVRPFELLFYSCILNPQPNPLYACDDEPIDGFAIFDLTESYTAALNGLNPSLYSVTYHNSQLDADLGNLSINQPFIYNGFDGEIIYVRVEESGTTTYGTTNFALTINPKPQIATITQSICSATGFSVTPSNTAPNVVPLGTTYTWTVASPTGITGATNQTTPQTIISQTLTNSTNTPINVVYNVTASSGVSTTTCTANFTITITVNPRPSIANVVQSICSTDTFVLTPTNTATVIVPTNTSYTWTVSVPAGISGASNQTNPQPNISQSLTNTTSNPITVVYMVTAISEVALIDCLATFTLSVTVNPLPTAIIAGDIVLCSSTEATITFNGTPGATVEYTVNGGVVQELVLDSSGFNSITDTYITTTIYTLLSVNNGTNPICSQAINQSVNITILFAPQITMPLPLEACDDDNPGDGLETFDLTLRANYILNGASLTEFALTYYENESDAHDAINEIPDPTNYSNTTPNGQIVWVRVTRIPGVNEPSCYQLVQLQLIVNPLPIIAESPIAFYQCEPIDDYTMAFVLSTMNPRVLGATQAAADYTVSYYITAADALAGTPSLQNVYTNISSPQIIYVRVVNNDTGCVNATGEVILEVEEGTQANSIPTNAPETTVCDSIGDNDGIYTFDFSGTLSSILLGTNNPVGTTVYYYENLADAQQATIDNDFSGAIASPEAYDNTTAQLQTIYAVLVNPATSSSCPTIVAIPLTIHLLPEPTPQGGTICLDPDTGELLNDFTIDSNLNPLTHTFVWTDAAGVEVGTGASITVTEPGIYTVVATNIATGCVSEPATAEVIYSQQAVVTYTVSNYFTENQTITVIATGVTNPNQNNDNYLYSFDNGQFQTNNVFTNVGFGRHNITVQDINGCLDTTIEAFVINYPRFFTPNGDGQNDTWNIVSLREVNPTAKIYIFDRYGKFIKQISLGVGWDGTFNGEALPSTDYWFSVEYEEQGEAKVFKAHFSLKR